MSYPLLGGFLDLPRFITFSIEGLAVGWWSFRRRRVEVALRESENRYELAMNASDEGFWDWIVAGDKLYVSPRFVELLGFPAGTTFAGRAAMLKRLSIPQEDRAALEHAIAEHFAGKTARMEMEFRILAHGEVRWIHAAGRATRDSQGQVLRWNGAIRDVTTRQRTELALRESEERYALAWKPPVTATPTGIWKPASTTSRPRLLKLCGYAPGTTFRTARNGCAGSRFIPTTGRSGNRRSPRISPAASRTSRWSCVLWWAARCAGPRFTSSPNAMQRASRSAGPDRSATSPTGSVPRKRCARVEERYSLALEAAEEGYVDSDIDTDQFVTSERLNEIFGIPRSTRFADRSDFLKHFRFYGDDAELYGDMYPRCRYAGRARSLRVRVSHPAAFGRSALALDARQGNARRRGPGATANRRGLRHHRAQARRRGAARIRAALRARHGCERVGILGLARPDQPVFCLAESVRTGWVSARNHVGQQG